MYSDPIYVSTRLRTAMSGLSAAELGQRAGTTPERVHRLADLGILDPSDGVFQSEDVSRVRLAEAIDRAGISLEDMAHAIADGHLSFSWFHGLLPQAVPLSTRTVTERAAEVGLPGRVLERAFEAFGLPSPRGDEPIREDDARQLEHFVRVFEAMNRDEEVFAGAVRAVGEHLRQISESQMAFSRASIIDRLIEQGLSTTRGDQGGRSDRHRDRATHLPAPGVAPRPPLRDAVGQAVRSTR